MLEVKMFKSTIYAVLVVIVVATLGCGGGGDTVLGPSLTDARWGHTATTLNDGRVLVVGGQQKPSKPLDTAEIFDPVSSTWSSAGKLSVKRGEGHTSVLLNDGSVLVFGDTDEGSAEIYEPASGTWSVTGSMVDPRRWASASVLEDGRVLVAGGSDVTKTGGSAFTTAEIYDPSSGTWSAIAPMMEEHYGQSSASVGGKVILFGEFLAEIYDPGTGIWSSGGVPAVPRAQGTNALVRKDGKIMVSGGEWQQPGWYGQNHVMGTIQIFDPATLQFDSESIPPMSSPRIYHYSFPQADGRIVMVGGAEVDGEPETIEAYTPSTNLWAPIANLSVPRGRLYTANELGDGRILIVGGKQETDDKKFVGIGSSEIYNPSAATE